MIDTSNRSPYSVRARWRGLIAAALACAATLTLSGCGSSSTTKDTATSTQPSNGSASQPSASLILDFTPNAIHSGIYLALARNYDRQAGVKLHVISPGASTDSIDLLLTGRVQFAILDIHDLAIADASNPSSPSKRLVGIMAIVQRPLAAVIAEPSITSPAALVGKTVGVTGDPSDLAVLRSIVSGAGANPAKLHTITIGYNAVPDLLADRLSAATAFWNDEGVTLTKERKGFHVFRVERYGAPAYPELVLCATEQTLQSHPALARAVVHAIQRGYVAAIADPTAAAKALLDRVDGLSSAAVNSQLAAEVPAFKPAAGQPIGGLDPTTLNAWSKWEAKFGIVKTSPDVSELFDASFLDLSIR